MHQKSMEFKRGINQQEPITIKNDISPIIKIAAIIFGPALLVASFFALFLKEYEIIADRMNDDWQKNYNEFYNYIERERGL